MAVMSPPDQHWSLVWRRLECYEWSLKSFKACIFGFNLCVGLTATIIHKHLCHSFLLLCDSTELISRESF